MEKGNYKGTELNNVKETWDQNERNLQNNGSPGTPADEAVPLTELDKLVKQEATEYDNENKENRVLSGDRATVNDEPGSVDSK